MVTGGAPFVVRRMLSEDAAAVADLTSQLGYPSSESQIKRRYDLVRERWDARLFVAQHAEQGVVGWIHVQATYLLASDPRAEIWGLVVAESARGTGAGRGLVEAAEEWSLRFGLHVVVVRSNDLRIQAQGFYEHLGYKITKTQNAFHKTLS